MVGSLSCLLDDSSHKSWLPECGLTTISNTSRLYIARYTTAEPRILSHTKRTLNLWLIIIGGKLGRVFLDHISRVVCLRCRIAISKGTLLFGWSTTIQLRKVAKTLLCPRNTTPLWEPKVQKWFLCLEVKILSTCSVSCMTVTKNLVSLMDREAYLFRTKWNLNLKMRRDWVAILKVNISFQTLCDLLRLHAGKRIEVTQFIPYIC